MPPSVLKSMSSIRAGGPMDKNQREKESEGGYEFENLLGMYSFSFSFSFCFFVHTALPRFKCTIDFFSINISPLQDFVLYKMVTNCYKFKGKSE